MRARELKIGEAYATCNGSYIRIVDNNTNWAMRPDPSQESKLDAPVQVELDDSDPWRGCHTQRRGPSEVRGCNVKYFDVNRNGNPVGDGRSGIVNPRDVSGTWLLYLSLYAETVRAKADSAAEEERLANTAKALALAMRSLVGGHRVWVHPRTLYARDKAKGVVQTFSVDIYDLTEAEVQRLITKFKESEVST